jgi:hypothetical protein
LKSGRFLHWTNAPQPYGEIFMMQADAPAFSN